VRSIKNSLLLYIIYISTSCQYFRQDVEKTPIAQVYNNVLYLEDINPTLYKKNNKQDSLKNVHEYIEKWAYKTLLTEQAKKNLDTISINKLVAQFKQDLLIDTYKDLLSEKYLDTIVPESEIKESYKNNKKYFLARNDMINVSFLVINKENKDKRKYKKWFFSDKIEFRDSLVKNSWHFPKFNINIDNWKHLSDFKDEFPVFKRIRDVQILKKSKKFVLTDSLSLYLVLVNDFVRENNELPLPFIKNDLKQLIINIRKQKVISKLQNEIKSEAIKQKKFKIFKIKKNDE
jgi:hypothetical protein